MRVPREWRALHAAALDAGWTVQYSRGGHLRWIPPDRSKPIVTTGSTPGDWRALKNDRARLRRAGLNI